MFKMKKFFVVKIPYPDTLFINLTLCIVIKNQYSPFYYECGFLILSLLLNTGGRWGNLVFIFGFSNVKTSPWILTESEKTSSFFVFCFADQCYLSLKIRPYFIPIFSTYTLAALHYAGNVTVEGV